MPMVQIKVIADEAISLGVQSPDGITDPNEGIATERK